ncbi:FAD dependent oxidoreductase-domain-containing protein [Aspergillus pseudotamarii]|uniref:FAD dependent oxidoreductase-domain-containing protein n=1 Tax=Aspergillus pseudotamarii TaxID=132259 RepID=A0A5N6SY50_ASPPS|nr:FAD dependent oxidoreductase-domain-containing protein [Aspergillus pseudotamarii]KAE8139616.1 FAD dependent oxidoreductase-domain-containing protein [Aspergillus pseudotamarii]
MGAILSRISETYHALAAFWSELSQNTAESNALLRRIATPEFPVPDPTVSFWQTDPKYPELVNARSEELPQSADVVIIGSGISGASVAYTILTECQALGIEKRVVILEARQVCSGATGRNGGHLKCSPYLTYSDLKVLLGKDKAKRVLHFQLRHLPTILELVKDEGLDEAEAREVETVDLFTEQTMWEKAQEMVQELRQDAPEYAEDTMVWDAKQAQEQFGASSHCLGAISYRAGAMWPYRLITSIYMKLKSKYQSSFVIETGATVREIYVEDNDTTPYLLYTSRGQIRATHVVHATDAYAPNLIPGLKGKIFPVRGHMSAQKADGPSSHLDGSRSWSIIGKKGYEYITQRPRESADPHSPGGEIMLGGGLYKSDGKGMDEIGIWKDNCLDPTISAYLSGIWSTVLQGEHACVLQLWTGCMGFTPDLVPFVGEVSPTFTKRQRASKKRKTTASESGSTPANEWITAGFNGDGMVLAWLSGAAVGLMVLGREDVHLEARAGRPAGKVTDWLPKELYLSESRVRDLSIFKLARFL